MHADKLINEALSDGRLDANAHAGKPLPPMNPHDPGWWVRDLLKREALPDRYADALASADQLLMAATESADLSKARSILADRNAGVSAWNDEVPDTHHIDVVDEPTLLDLRAKHRRGSD